MDIDQAQLESDLRMIAFAGKNVIYRRGERAITWRAIPGTTKFDLVSDNVVTTWESEDFIGEAALLVFDDEPTAGPIEPQRGDRIWRQVRSSTLVYEVQNLANEPCYKYSDPDRAIIRIHCKLID